MLLRALVLLVLLASVVLYAETAETSETSETSERAQTLVFLGDSLTAGYGLDETAAYPALIQARMPAWRVVNAGVSGDTSAGALRRLAWVLKAKPDVVFIAIGANDGLRGLTVEQLHQNLLSIIARIRAAGAKSVLAGMQLPANYGEDYRTRFAAVYPAVASEAKIPLMPFLLDGVAMKPELNQSDTVHPNAAGQQVIATQVLAFLHPPEPLRKPVTEPNLRQP